MTLFKEKYRVESARKAGRDYRDNGWYFITVVTKDRVPFFGNIQNQQMNLSHIGRIISNEWVRISDRPWIYLDSWVIMPNHFHGIIRINRPEKRSTKSHILHNERNDAIDVNVHIETPHDAIGSLDIQCSANAGGPWGVSTITIERSDPAKSPPLKSSRLYANSIGSIINQFKSACTKRIWAAGYRHFAWQPRFHDSIIHDE